MIDQNTLRINFRIFKFRMLAAGDCAHAQLVVCVVCGNASITIIAGLIDADSGPLGSESHSISTPWQRTDRGTVQ